MAAGEEERVPELLVMLLEATAEGTDDLWFSGRVRLDGVATSFVDDSVDRVVVALDLPVEEPFTVDDIARVENFCVSMLRLMVGAIGTIG